jgi:hypothetical protein
MGDMAIVQWLVGTCLVLVGLVVSIWAMRNARRRDLAALRPCLILDFVPEPAGRQCSEIAAGTVCIRNSGTGAAYNVGLNLRFELRPTGQPRTQVVEGASLGIGESRPVEVVIKRPRISGTMACEDADGNAYWWRKASFDSAWESGKGRLPEA